MSALLAYYITHFVSAFWYVWMYSCILYGNCLLLPIEVCLLSKIRFIVLGRHNTPNWSSLYTRGLTRTDLLEYSTVSFYNHKKLIAVVHVNESLRTGMVTRRLIPIVHSYETKLIKIIILLADIN